MLVMEAFFLRAAGGERLRDGSTGVGDFSWDFFRTACVMGVSSDIVKSVSRTA